MRNDRRRPPAGMFVESLGANQDVRRIFGLRDLRFDPIGELLQLALQRANRCGVCSAGRDCLIRPKEFVFKIAPSQRVEPLRLQRFETIVSPP